MNSSGPFVDRPVPIGLFERLYPHEGGEIDPLPVVVVTGPGGSGKTRLVDYLYTRAKEPLTCARVRVRAENGPTSVPDLLHTIKEELATDHHRQCGLIPFPRYNLARWMYEAALRLGPHPDGEDVRAELKRLLNRRYRAPSSPGQASQNIFVLLFEWFIGLLLAAFSTRPSVFRMALWGRRREVGFTWVEQVQTDIDLPGNRYFDDAIRRMCSLLSSGPTGTTPGEARAVDAFLLSAFLDDVHAAFDPKRSRNARLRTSYCVALVDDLDWLPDGEGAKLLDLLAERGAGGGHGAPMLFLLTSGRRDLTSEPRGTTDDEDENTVGSGDAGGPGGPGDPAAAAVTPSVDDLYRAWWENLDSAMQRQEPLGARIFLRVSLSPLSREQVRLLLDRQAGTSAAADELRVDEVYEVTHGHPLAVRLAAAALARQGLGRRPVGVRRLLDDPADPADLTDAPEAAGFIENEPGESSAEFLLRRFHEPVAHRLDPPLLAACAAPRYVTMEILQEALNLSNAEGGGLRAREVWDELVKWEFVTVDQQAQRLTLHPLLRDLLLRRLAKRQDPGELSHIAVHTRLASHFAAQPDPRARVEQMYHWVAAGRLQPVVRGLERLAETDRDVWRSTVLELAGAPWPLQPSGRIIDFGSRLRDRLPVYSSLSYWQLERERTLSSPASDAAWTNSLMEQSLRPSPAEPADPASLPPLVRTDMDDPFPCLVRKSYRGARRVAVAGAVLAPILGYLGLYGSYRVDACDPVRPLDVVEVVSDQISHQGLYTRRAGGECIGMSAGQAVFDHRTDGVMERIADQNARVMRLARTADEPYVTAVVVTALTSPGHGGRSWQVTAGRETLRGVYLAQRRYNQDGYRPRLRVLVANAGRSFRHADEVARQIARLAEQDPSVVAVLGLNQTRPGTRDAIRILNAAGLPMIASAATGDRLGERTDYFFRVAVPNRRQARIAAAYAKGELGARTAIVVKGVEGTEGEEPVQIPPDGAPASTRVAYSSNLGEAFERAFTDDHHQLVYPEDVTYHPKGGEVANELRMKAVPLCRADPDLVYYAGRAVHMLKLLRAMQEAGCDPDIAIMGAHTLARLQWASAGNAPELRRSLHYTTLASPALWHSGREPGFYRDYRSRFAGSWPAGVAVLAYDATGVLLEALHMLRDDHSPPPGRVRENITYVDVGNPFAGASGMIAFSAGNGGDPAGKAVAIVRVKDFRTPVTVVGTCGDFRTGGANVARTEPIPCPEK